MPISETERRIRTKRRVGCGIISMFLAAALLLGLAWFWLKFVRVSPAPETAALVPAQSNAVAVARLPALKPVLTKFLEGQSDVSPEKRAAVESLGAFFHPDIVISARAATEQARSRWMVVLSIKRAPDLVREGIEKVAGDLLVWEPKSSDGAHRFSLKDSPNVKGELKGSRLRIGEYEDWPLSPATAPATAVESPMRAVESTAAISFSMDNRDHWLESSLRSDLLSTLAGPETGKAAASLLETAYLELGSPMTMNFEAQPAGDEFKLAIAFPRSAQTTQPAVDAAAHKFAEGVAKLAGVPATTAHVETSLQPETARIEVSIPAGITAILEQLM